MDDKPRRRSSSDKTRRHSSSKKSRRTSSQKERKERRGKAVHRTKSSSKERANNPNPVPDEAPVHLVCRPVVGSTILSPHLCHWGILYEEVIYDLTHIKEGEQKGGIGLELSRPGSKRWNRFIKKKNVGDSTLPSSEVEEVGESFIKKINVGHSTIASSEVEKAARVAIGIRQSDHPESTKVPKSGLKYNVRSNNCQQFIREMVRRWNKLGSTTIRLLPFEYVTRKTTTYRLSRKKSKLVKQRSELVKEKEKAALRSSKKRERKAREIAEKDKEIERVRKEIQKKSSIKRKRLKDNK